MLTQLPHQFFRIDQNLLHNIFAIPAGVALLIAVQNGVKPVLGKRFDSNPWLDAVDISLPLVLRLTGNGKSYDFQQACDIRRWLPGTHTEIFGVKIPAQLAPGRYTLEIGLISPHADVVCFATTAPRNGGFYEIGSIIVE